MVSQNNRVPRQKITYPSPSFFVDGSLDSVFLENSPDAIKIQSGISGYDLAGAFITSAKSISGITNFTPSPSNPNDPAAPIVPVAIVTDPNVAPDVPNLEDIEIVRFEEYPDPLTGFVKYNVILKVKNSSKNKSSVSGVDARIYNPNSANAYIFTPGKAASGSSASTVVPKITWYNAQSRCNPFSGVYGSSPAIIATAQYQADGKDVPADSISGSSSARIKSVWRKTSAEALEAAKNSACEL